MQMTQEEALNDLRKSSFPNAILVKLWLMVSHLSFRVQEDHLSEHILDAKAQAQHHVYTFEQKICKIRIKSRTLESVYNLKLHSIILKSFSEFYGHGKVFPPLLWWINFSACCRSVPAAVIIEAVLSCLAMNSSLPALIEHPFETPLLCSHCTRVKECSFIFTLSGVTQKSMPFL